MSATQSASNNSRLAARTQWIQSHARSILFLIALLAATGAMMAFSLPISLFPNIQFPRAQISLDSGDRPAEQMTALVTRPVEEALRKVPDLRGLISTSSRGSADISVSFDWGTDMYRSALQIQAALAEVSGQLPPGTSFTVRRMDPTVFPVIAYSLTSKDGSQSQAQLYTLAQFTLRPALSGINGVAQVNVTGGAQDEIEVAVDPVRLAQYKLAATDVSRAIAASNVVSASGRIEDHDKLYLIVTNNALNQIEQVKNVVISGGGTPYPIKLGQVASVTKGVMPQWTRVTADGVDAVLLNVYQQPGANSVVMSAAIRAQLDTLKSKLPPGVSLSSWYDQSELVVASGNSVRDAILIGVVLAALTLLFFLRNWKVTVIAILLVPAVLAPTVIFLKLAGMGFNIMTLGGMSAAVGLIIDDGIVMIEHIMRQMTSHSSDAEKDRTSRPGQILQSAMAFTRPLAGSSAATIVIFLPLAFLSGVTGAFFKALSLTMASALIVSFLFTWLAVPLICNKWLKAKDAKHHVGRLGKRINAGYLSCIQTVTRRPLIILFGIIPLLLVAGLAYTKVGSGFMPAMDEGGFVLDYHSAPGMSVTETDRLVRQVETILHANPNVLTWSRRTGAGLGGGLSEPNKGDFFVRLKTGQRPPIDKIMEDVRQQIESKVPGLQIELAQLMEDLIGDLTAVPQPIQIKLFSENPAELNTAAQKVAANIGKINGIVDVADGINPAGDSLELRIAPLAAAAEGMDVAAISQQVSELVQGNVGTYVLNGQKNTGIRVRILGALSMTDTDLANLTLRAPDGHLFALKRVAQIVPVSGEQEISRDNLRRTVSVTARLSNRDLGSAVAEVQNLIGKQGYLPSSVTYELGGLYQQQQVAFHGLMIVFISAMALVFTLLLFLYESFIMALAIIVMPLCAAASVFIGLWLTGTELNITAMMGMTMIIGIVTEVAIFYVSELLSLIRQDGLPLSAAIIVAGINRIRPIAMTTIAATLALLPVALAPGQGSAMQQPLAIAIISGLLIQMPLVLLALPAILAGCLRKYA